MAILRGAITSPGTRYTNDGKRRQRKELKHRSVNAIREVPLDPTLVGWLKRHCADWPDDGSGLVFLNHHGNPLDTKSYGEVWFKAREALWSSGHKFSGTTVYDLRHCTATTWLRAGVPPAEVAKRLGHGVDVLMRDYAGVFDGERDRSNQIIETELAEQRAPTET